VVVFGVDAYMVLFPVVAVVLAVVLVITDVVG